MEKIWDTTACPKCVGEFRRDYKFCPIHQKEYDEWLNAEYTPDTDCKSCGSKEWIDGELQMTSPPTYPLAKVFRCKKCNDIRTEVAVDGKVRILLRT